MTCIQCNGVKTVEVKVTEIGVGGSRKESSMTMSCPACHGTGELTDEEVVALQMESDLWCVCDHPGDPTFHPDGSDPEIDKHHWRCGTCRKVLQIG